MLRDDYSGTVISFPQGQDTSEEVQIDHVIPLAWAWRNGAAEWTDLTRTEFANDPLNLRAVDGPTNMVKSDLGPGDWLPSNAAFRCDYAILWVDILGEYGLSIPPADKRQLIAVLTSCYTMPHRHYLRRPRLGDNEDMRLRLPDRAKWSAVQSSALAQWARFRHGKLFIPVLVTVPLLALSGGVGGYAAWDSTRVNIPDVVGAPWPEGIAALEGLALEVDEGTASDDTISSSCFVVSTQSVSAGTRVVPDETIVALDVKPDQRPVPDVVGMSVADAREALEASCFHDEVLATWCVPDDFSGDETALTRDEFADETGFTYSAATGLLRDADKEPGDDWIVCYQAQKASMPFRASSLVGLAITVPLTVVPEAAGGGLGQALAALENTADACELNSKVVPVFKPDPAAIQGESLPSSLEASAWKVLTMQPAVGHSALCGSTVTIGVEWPSTAMPQLIGLHHVPETPPTATPATAALEGARLDAACSGRGTVTAQAPSAGSPVPVGTEVTCVAELLVPNIVGLDPIAANAVLAAAGFAGLGTGSGVVVSQSLIAGTIASSATQSVSFYSEQPRVSAPAYYDNCTAARNAGAAPLYRGDPGYRSGLDRDKDGIACE